MASTLLLGHGRFLCTISDGTGKPRVSDHTRVILLGAGLLGELMTEAIRVRLGHIELNPGRPEIPEATTSQVLDFLSRDAAPVAPVGTQHGGHRHRRVALPARVTRLVDVLAADSCSAHTITEVPHVVDIPQPDHHGRHHSVRRDPHAVPPAAGNSPVSDASLADTLGLHRPNVARTYDHWLGGGHSTAADRDFAQQVKIVLPDVEEAVWQNRAFVVRAVTYLISHGVRQFLDLGCGIPNVCTVHETAFKLAPDSKVVYVDIDPITVNGAGSRLAGDDHVVVLQADLRRPHTVLSHPLVRQTLDFALPVAVLMCAVLPFVADGDQPAAIVAEYREALCPGSFLVISHATSDGAPSGDLEAAAQLYRAAGIPVAIRTRQEIEALFDGVALVDPGLEFTADWHPEYQYRAPVRISRALAGIGEKTT